ncbi:MAG: AMP-binding protein, partial [Myxococcota bacterium]
MPDAKPDLLTAHATASPDKLAVIDDRPDGTERRWRYADLEERANRLANAMLGLGIQPRDRVIWCGPNSPDVVAMGHAARKIAATAVPLNYRFTPDEPAYVVDNCDAVFAWVDADQAGLFEEIRSRCPKLREVAIFGGPHGKGQLDGEALLDTAATPPAKPELEPRTMIYTS